MSANTIPTFVLTPIIGVASIATANTNRDGTGTLGTIQTGATDGTRIQGLVIEAAGTTTAGVVRIFIYNGTTNFLFKEYLVTAITPSTTLAAFRVEDYRIDGLPLIILPSATWVLKASTHNAETFNVFAIGGSY